MNLHPGECLCLWRPPGWRVVNNTGTWTAPAVPPSDGSDSDGEEFTVEDLSPDSPRWEDVDPGAAVEETPGIKCLLRCDVRLEDARELVKHCREEHALDLNGVRKKHELGFLQTIQLEFLRDEYLQPAMEDDALLYSIDELAGPEDAQDPLNVAANAEDEGSKKVDDWRYGGQEHEQNGIDARMTG
ncbi:hypothetical protein LTR22_027366 [Elasticomyces elasticus]|nr:hypothetical protein LTR22_027366 [Elasticomyces elasticus]KAK4901395.1 hypothetical protein LTR49_027300 [Elasticomyces elasticus]KAK5733342.1 hypothetical protein LTS12_026964 [Elasticomyces elasticus]